MQAPTAESHEMALQRRQSRDRELALRQDCERRLQQVWTGADLIRLIQR